MEIRLIDLYLYVIITRPKDVKWVIFKLQL